MKIIISESGGKPKNIVIPNFLFLSPPSLAMLTSYINKEAKKNGGDRIKYSRLAAIAKAVKKCKKDFGGEWTLVDIVSADGECVNIIL